MFVRYHSTRLGALVIMGGRHNNFEDQMISSRDLWEEEKNVNAKIHSKEHEFSPSKCFNIHIVLNEDCSEGLKVHDKNIINKTFDTILDYEICSSGSNRKILKI